MNVSMCPGGHKLVPWRSTGERNTARCPICLAHPIKEVFFQPTLRAREEFLRSLLFSVSRSNFPESLDVETVSSNLAKDKDWRNKQLEVMRGIQKALMMAKLQNKVTFFKKLTPDHIPVPLSEQRTVEWRPFVNLLIECGILDVVILLLKLRVSNPADEVDKLGDPWHAVYYFSLDIIANIMLSSYWENPKAKKFIHKIAQSEFVGAAMAFVDDTKHFLAMVLSIYNLCHIYEDHPQAGMLLARSPLLSKLGVFIHKDNSVRIMNRWMNQGIFNFQVEVMMENQAGLLPMRSTSVFDIGEPMEYTDEDIKDIGIQFASTLQQSSLQCIGYLAKHKQVRAVVVKDQFVGKAIGRWVRMPVLSPENRYMLEACVKVLAEMAYEESFAWKLLDEHGFMPLLENGVYYPEADVVWHYFEVATRIAMHRGLLIKRIVENPKIMRAAAIHMYSLDININIYATALLALAVDNPGVEYIIKYFGPKHFYHYPSYFFSKTPKIGIKIDELQAGCRRYGRKEFDKAQKEFRKMRNQTLDSGKATQLKEGGNEMYKSGEIQEAIKLYTRALNVCPPSIPVKTAPNFLLGAMPQWSSLPATLFSNRAQCYLNVGEYELAVEDCDEAIARCFGGTCPEDPTLADTIRLKAMFRRSKALFELGKYFRAVQDAGECQINQPSETFKAHLDKVMMRFRNIMGMDPVQRCDECRQTNGFKLKRCANCMALYCSKKCQEVAWVRRHKVNCQEYQVEKEAKKNKATADGTARAMARASCNGSTDLE
ncbi:uncharacterized protein LOC110989846 [Acanthaster planci]|uniref:Uncharacterized protein LOC110989846 n=1 Tax=Acanthaster planci TaxID=133434 RepID=A0A8B7ZXC8_ACAPL|nr:uncharacterized protein LOC110989846 [Acanthaster planci]